MVMKMGFSSASWICSLHETESLAQSLAELLRPGDVIAFRGGMGAGKTAFVRGLARGLATAAEVDFAELSSPSRIKTVRLLLW